MNSTRTTCLAMLACAAAILGAAVAPVAADAVKLSNGDTIHGQVRSLSETEIVIVSDVLGEVKLPRERVAMIALGKNATFDQAAAKAEPAPKPGIAPENQTAEDALRQLQETGVSAEQMNRLRKEMPLLAMPEAKGYFDKTVTGLMSGSIDLNHVRKDALKARDELELLKKDLGPNGYILNGYLSILNNFINETEPKQAAEPPATEAEQK